MEVPSCPAQRGAVPWLWFLLTALLLTFWSPPTAAQYRPVPVELVPPNALKGKDVLLVAHSLSEKYRRLEWFINDFHVYNSIVALTVHSKEIIEGPLYKRRHTLYPNGTLLIRNLKETDEGIYQLRVFTMLSDFEYGTAELHVYGAVMQPSIRASYASVVLTCEPYGFGVSTRWYLNDKELQPTETRKLSSDNRTLTLEPISWADEGDYWCEVFNPANSSQSAHIKLKVTAK